MDFGKKEGCEFSGSLRSFLFGAVSKAALYHCEVLIEWSLRDLRRILIN